MTGSGLILLNKKPGITSFDALNEIKRALGTGKVGHTGTLDKFAQGLLLVLAGKALKLSQWFTHCDKRYTGRIFFGIETDTLDTEGVPAAHAPVPSLESVLSAMIQFKGSFLQEPPVYSAIHINGKRASCLARGGKLPEMTKRRVNVYSLELLKWEPPYADIGVHCSSGTYIRSLARDIALSAGSRAHLCSLVRTQVAGFSLESAASVIGEKAGLLHQIDKTVINALGMPWFEVSREESEDIAHGKPLERILQDKTPFSAGYPASSFINDKSSFPAAVFYGDSLAAVVENTEGRWKYGCVL